METTIFVGSRAGWKFRAPSVSNILVDLADEFVNTLSAMRT